MYGQKSMVHGEQLFNSEPISYFFQLWTHFLFLSTLNPFPISLLSFQRLSFTHLKIVRLATRRKSKESQSTTTKLFKDVIRASVNLYDGRLCKARHLRGLQESWLHLCNWELSIAPLQFISHCPSPIYFSREGEPYVLEVEFHKT